MTAVIARIALALFLFLTLVGCAGRTPTPTREVAVATAVACVAPEDVPTPPSGLGSIPQDAQQALAKALDKLLEHMLYARQADRILRRCSTLDPGGAS